MQTNTFDSINVNDNNLNNHMLSLSLINKKSISEGIYIHLVSFRILLIAMNRKVFYPVLFCIFLLVIIIGAWLIYNHQQQSASNPSQNSANTSPTPSPTPQFINLDEIPQFTYENILSGEPVIALNHLDPELITTIITTGDIIPARGVDNRIRIHGTSYPFQGAGITELLESGDLTISNLEAPLLDNCPVHNEGFTFCGQSGFAKAMSDVGIDIVTMENNHVGNYGPDGINETISHLEKAGIDYATSAQLAIKSINGMKVGIIAFTGVGGQFYPQDMINKIKTAKTQVDLLIGAFHWGKEYELIPTADPGVAPDDPKQIAKLAVDAGLDLIIGNHPHWVQGAEMLNESLVTYAHGNFIFDQSWSSETSQGIIGKLTYYKNKLIQAQFYPVMIKDQAQPNIATGTEAEIIMSRFRQSSQQLQAQKTL